ncbi:hypothetical protein Prudu_021497 [Prunus dulcis]|uniref:Uncharacterized protein n=1 Tax=Prunus dulcis TaxID=3755 RepID=A0A4Y1RYV9_PRUDU|nr:hypothetical protein Prudu_021497 [Prunus dulcis]
MSTKNPISYSENLTRTPDFTGTQNLEKLNLPSEVELACLETFDLSGCSKVKKIPEFVGEMKNFSKLSLSFTAVEQNVFITDTFDPELEGD